MPVTRSASKPISEASGRDRKQDAAPQRKPSTKKSGPASNATKAVTQSKLVAAPNSSKKRAPSKNNGTSEVPKKKVKLSKPDREEKEEAAEDEEVIKINRSPVLQLWASTVAAFLHPGETWDTCLSIGSAISTLCAIFKGKAIGQIEPQDKSPEQQDKKQKRKKEAKKDSYELEVMGFNLHIKDGAAIVDGKPKHTKESLLKGKYGGEDTYDKVKKTMEDALQTWSDDKDELDKKAFHMYEKFRPTVPAGQSGWGRKGELKLQNVQNTIKK